MMQLQVVTSIDMHTTITGLLNYHTYITPRNASPACELH
jgi:hypothetical protein